MKKQKERAKLLQIKSKLATKGVVNFDDYFTQYELSVMNTELDGYNMEL